MAATSGQHMQDTSADSGPLMEKVEIDQQQDLANKAFEAFSKGQFKETQKFLDKICPPSSQDKNPKVLMNTLLTDFYANKGKFPQKLLSELIALAQDTVEISRVPVCQIKPATDGTQNQIVHLGNIYQGPLNSPLTAPQSDQTQLSGGSSHRSTSQSQKQNSAQVSGYGGVSDIVPSQNATGSGASFQGIHEANTILLYNIAAMSYQMQQYGQAMTYLIELLKRLEFAEEFIILKGMFLLLQILFELRQTASAWPVIAFLDIKLSQAQSIIQAKQNIRAHGGAYDSSMPFIDSLQFGAQEESKGSTGVNAASGQDGSGYYMMMETLDETILLKNSFSIINASYIRKHAVCPRNMNIHEYKILLQSYKAMFHLLQNDITLAHQEIKLATELRAKHSQDPVKVKQNISEYATIQHQGLVNNIKALIHLGQNKVMKSIKNLSFDEKDYPKVHPSCFHVKHNDDHSKHDVAYQKCLSNHPQYYFNNLGVVHLKLQKYSLAIFYFSKALKFLEKSQNGQPAHSYDKENPNDHISNLSSQKTPEILYNYGLALYKSGKLEEAFRCFEKASATLKHNPRLWYYMGLSTLQLNQKKLQDKLKGVGFAPPSGDQTQTDNQGGLFNQSDMFYRMAPSGPNSQQQQQQSYTKVLGTGQHRRFILTPSGDLAIRQKELMGEWEQSQIEKIKQQQAEILKQMQSQQSQKQSKAQQKKEKLAQQQKQSQLPVDSMSLQSSIMYMQNALMAIETSKQNEINYAFYIKFIIRQQALTASPTLQGASGVSSTHQMPAQSQNESLNDSTDTQSLHGGEDANPLQSVINDFPQNQAELNAEKAKIVEKYEKKYGTLKKNINLHLCYMYLLTYDYANVIKVGNGILRNQKPNPKTRQFKIKLTIIYRYRFQVLQYLAEAHCMLGQTQQALDCLKAENANLDDFKVKFDNLTTGIRETQSPVPAKAVCLLNQSAVLMCGGQLEQAKQCFDQVLESLDLKLQTSDTDSKWMIPGYIANLLVYFYIKTKNLKMARQLLKSRRFLLDTNSIPIDSEAGSGTGGRGVSTAQKARNQSKTLIKNFI